jgi:hypothetical protein
LASHDQREEETEISHRMNLLGRKTGADEIADAALFLASGALANGTNAGTIQIAAAIPFVIDGVLYSKAITNNITIPYTAPATVYGQPSNGSFTGGPTGSTRLYGLYMDTAGAVSIVPGPIVDTAVLAAGGAALHFPASVRNLVNFGVMRVAVTSGTTFIPGTTALNAAGVTTTYLNLSQTPAEPLRS